MNKISLFFKDKKILEQALTHKSWVSENVNARQSNERLEFLGDAVLELVVTDHLFRRFPEKSEGYLTKLRSNIVNTINLSVLAKKLKIDELIFFSVGETELGRKNNSILADAVESVIGGIYIDGGYKKAEKFILENLLQDLEAKTKGSLRDPKSMLQEILQKKKDEIPLYKTTKITGPKHAPLFTVQVFVDGKVCGTGIGKNQKEAQQSAASAALKDYSL